jgi:hypothetical protein
MLKFVEILLENVVRNLLKVFHKSKMLKSVEILSENVVRNLLKSWNLLKLYQKSVEILSENVVKNLFKLGLKSLEILLEI